MSKQFKKRVSSTYIDYLTDVLCLTEPTPVPQLIFETYSVKGYDPEYIRVIREVPVAMYNSHMLHTFLHDTYAGESKTALGLCSKTGMYHDYHLPLLDFDFDKMLAERACSPMNYIWGVAEDLLASWGQQKVYVIRSSSRGVHLCGNTQITWPWYEDMLHSIQGLDKRYVDLSCLRRYGTLRISNCEDKPEVPELVGILRKAGK